jgi:uncharacterized protein YifE (UPF0438 family)
MNMNKQKNSILNFLNENAINHDKMGINNFRTNNQTFFDNRTMPLGVSRKHSNPNFEQLHREALRNAFKKNSYSFNANNNGNCYNSFNISSQTESISPTKSNYSEDKATAYRRHLNSKKANLANLNKHKAHDTSVNSEILKVTINYDHKELTLSLSRFDDIYLSTKSFFEINKLPDRFIKPIIYKICENMNKIFTTYNQNLTDLDMDYLTSLKTISENFNLNNKPKKDLSTNDIKYNSDEDVCDNISSLSAMSWEGEGDDLSFFKLNKSF